MPMGDASSVPPIPQDGEMGPDGMDGGMPQDDGMEPPMPQDGEMGPDGMDGGMPQDDGMEPPMEGDGDDSTMSIIDQLSDTDKEAVRSYAQSMLDRSESNGGDGPAINGEDGADGFNPQENGPMMERIILKKKQFEKINENFGEPVDSRKEQDRKPLIKKKNSKVSSKSPFNSPKFN